jgi:SAM-dependent methyltransferase
LPPLRSRLLAHWIAGGTTLGPRGRWMFTGLSHALDLEYYDPATSTARREAIKALCMGDESGVRWARQYLERGFPDRYTPLIAMFGELESRLASGLVESVHQVGCCSGREIAYFARRFPAVAFTGSDSDPEIVDFLHEHWRDLANLRFVQLRMETSDDAEMENLRADLVYASGGLHYMDPQSLLRFFIRARALSTALLLSQPLVRAYPAGDTRESTPRGQLSWNHPYPYYLKQAGWTRVEWSEGLSEELPALKNISAWAGA